MKESDFIKEIEKCFYGHIVDDVVEIELDDVSRFKKLIIRHVADLLEMGF